MADNKKESKIKKFFSVILEILFGKRVKSEDENDSSITNEEIVFYDTIDDD